MFDNSRNLVYSLTDEIGFGIVNGDFSRDERFFSESEISRKYGVGKGIVRQSIKILHAKGLLHSHAKTGIKLTTSESWSLFDVAVLDWMRRSKFNYDFLLELIVLQKGFEPEAARLAANNYGDMINIYALSLALKKIESSEHLGESAISAEIDFHIIILNLSKNRFLIQMHKVIEVSTRLKYALLNQSSIKPLSRAHYYRMIFEAVKVGDSELASTLIERLIKVEFEMINAMGAENLKSQRHGRPREELIRQSLIALS